MVARIKRKKNSKYFLAALAVLAVIILGGAAYAVRHYILKPAATKTTNSPTVKPPNTVDYSPSKPQDNTANDQRKSSSNPATTLDNGPTQTTDTHLSVQIVSANVNNSNVHIGTIVSGVTTGTCVLTATQGATTTTLETLTIKQDVNNYDCGGKAINIATSQFHPSTGTWQLKLTATSGGSQATDSASVHL